MRLRVGLNQVDMEDSRRRDTLPRQRQHRSRDIATVHVPLFANRPSQPQQCSASAAAYIENRFPRLGGGRLKQQVCHDLELLVHHCLVPHPLLTGRRVPVLDLGLVVPDCRHSPVLRFRATAGDSY